MAIGFLRVSECGAKSAIKFQYDTREGRYKNGGEDFVAKGSQSLPAWAEADPAAFWKAADKFEKGNKCKAMIIALPKELKNKELENLARDACEKLFPGHALTWAIHRPKGRLSGEDNPHLHVMICERLIDPSRPNLPPEQYFKKTRTRKDGSKSGGYAKDVTMTKTDRRKWLDLTKAAWEKVANKHLEMAASKAAVKFKKYPKKRRSIHLGPNVMIRMIKGQETKLGTRWFDNQISAKMQRRAKDIDEKERRFGDTSVMQEMWVLLRHPLSNKNREKLRKSFRNKNIAKMRNEYFGNYEHFNTLLQWTNQSSATELRENINQLNNLAKWGKKKGLGNGIITYRGKWRNTFAMLRKKLEEMDETEARVEAYQRKKAQEAVERKRKEKEAAERTEETVTKKEVQITEKKPALQQQEKTPIQVQPKPRQQTVRVLVHKRESRGRGRSR